MLSAIVLAFPPFGAPSDAPLRRERVSRSLSSLVEACVHGLVADAILVGPAELSLEKLADEAGCTLIETRDAKEGLFAALKAARHPHVFLLTAGHAVERSFIEEVGDLFAYGDMTRARLLRAAPNSLLTRLAPGLAEPVGIVVRRAEAASVGASDVKSLSRRTRAIDLKSRARRAI